MDSFLRRKAAIKSFIFYKLWTIKACHCFCLLQCNSYTDQMYCYESCQFYAILNTKMGVLVEAKPPQDISYFVFSFDL